MVRKGGLPPPTFEVLSSCVSLTNSIDLQHEPCLGRRHGSFFRPVISPTVKEGFSTLPIAWGGWGWGHDS